MSSQNTPPKPEEVHYSAKVPSSLTVSEAVSHWLHEAKKAILYEYSEEIDAGEMDTTGNWWKAQLHRRALEMIDADDELRPVYQARIYQDIEDNALFHYAGYESAEEWFASEANLKKGGQHYELKALAQIVIPWCKAKNIFKTQADADAWFFTPKNKTGESRMRRLRDILPELKRVIANDYKEPLTVQEQRVIVSNALKTVAGDLPGETLLLDLNEIRGKTKPVIHLHLNGDGRWHGQLNLDEHQLERFKLQNKYSAIIIVEPEALRAEDEDWWLEGRDPYE